MRTFVITCRVMLLSLILVTTEQVNGKRILAVLPAPSYSHQIVYRSLCLALNKRGHEMVVVTPNPLNDSTLTNYVEIDSSQAYKIMSDLGMREHIRNRPFLSPTEFDRIVHDLINKLMTYTLTHPQLRQLYAADSNEKFDAVIVETLLGPGLHPLAHRFNAPLIGLQSVELNVYQQYDLGSQMLPSHPSTWEYYEHTGTNLSFWTRLQNFLEALRSVYGWQTNVVNKHDEIVRGIFGDDLPHITEYTKNMSILLINHDIVIGYARPLPPNVILFNGFHIAKKPPLLPKSMKDFLDKATNGFIYMSLGTNVNTADLTSNVIEAILNVFSKLPYRVLWKFDQNELPRKLDNVYSTKWVPQQGVLAHRNIKLFIYQGGLQSSEETIHYAVPIIGIPLIFEQTYRIGKLVSLGVGRQLNILRITEEVFYEAIDEVINNKRYKMKMIELRALVKDKPRDTMEDAIWWIEHVMRHKGQLQLRFSEVDQPWYKRYDTDIIAFLAIVFFLVVVLFVVVLMKIFLWSLKYFHVQPLCIFGCLFSWRRKNTKTE